MKMDELMLLVGRMGARDRYTHAHTFGSNVIVEWHVATEKGWVIESRPVEDVFLRGGDIVITTKAVR